MNEERFVIISTDEFEGRIYDRLDNEFLNLEQIVDLLNWLNNENSVLRKENERLNEKIDKLIERAKNSESSNEYKLGAIQVLQTLQRELSD